MWRRAWEALQGIVVVLALAAIMVLVAAAGLLSRPWGIR